MGHRLQAKEPAGPARRSIAPTGLAAGPERCEPEAELFGGKEQEGAVPRDPAAPFRAAAGAAPRPVPPWMKPSHPRSLKRVPYAIATDRFTARSGKRQPGARKRGQEGRCRLCCALRNLCLAQT